jgi:hypothetical protein
VALRLVSQLASFDRRARVALVGALPLEDGRFHELIGDGAAAALGLEAELVRLERRRQAVLPRAGRSDAAARQALDLGEDGRGLRGDLAGARGLLVALMRQDRGAV